MDLDDELFALAYLVYRRQKQKKKRRWGVRPLLRARNELGEYHHLVRDMRNFDSEIFFKYFRMEKRRFDWLCEQVGPVIQKHSKRPSISVPERLAATLRYLATGDSQQTISFSYRLGRSTTSYILRETCAAIWSVLSPIYLPAPNEEALKKTAIDFERIWNFPHCVGAIDGKHVTVQAPRNSGSEYFNYKGYFSVVLLAVADANYCFSYVDIGAQGRQSDSGLFSSSGLGEALEANTLSLPKPEKLSHTDLEMPYFFVGDAAFPLKLYMQRPFPGSDLSVKKRVYNYRLSRARRIVENAFGIAASRWRILRRPIVAKPEHVNLVIKAIVCLHNFLKTTDIQEGCQIQYCPTTYIDREDSAGAVVDGGWRQDIREHGGSNLQEVTNMGVNRCGTSATACRERMANYFLSPVGQVPWQMDVIQRGL